MAIRGITQTFNNSVTGVATTADGISMIISHAVPTAGFLLNTMYTLTKLSDLATLLIDSNYDSTNSVSIYRQVSDFYSLTGDGSVLYLIGVDKGDSTMSTFISSSEFKDMLRQTAYSAGQPSPNTIVKLLGISFSDDTTAPTGTDVYFQDVIPSMNAIQTVINFMYNQNEVRIACAIIDANNCLSMTSAVDCTTLGNNSCYLLHYINGNASTSISNSVGYCLGILALNSVQYDLGNVQYGQIKDTNPKFPDGTYISSYSQNDFANFAIKNIGFVRTWPGKSGYYFHDGSTCDLAELSLSTIANQRIKTKISDLMYSYFINFLGSTPPLGPDGNVLGGYLSAMGQEFYTSRILPMQQNTISNGNDLNSGEVGPADIQVKNVSVFTSTKTLDVRGEYIAPTPINNINSVSKFVISLTTANQQGNTARSLGINTLSLSVENSRVSSNNVLGKRNKKNN